MADRWPPQNRPRVPQPVWPAHYTLRDSHHDREVRSEDLAWYAVFGRQTRKPPYHSAHDRDPSSPRWRRHQHHPCLVGSRLTQYDECLCRSGSGDEGQSSCNLRSDRESTTKALEERRYASPVSTKPLIHYVASAHIE